MSYRCDHCGKGSLRAVKRSHRRGIASHKFQKRAPKTLRRLKPNLHSAKILVAGTVKKMRLCTKCLRKLKSQNAKVKSTSQK